MAKEEKSVKSELSQERINQLLEAEAKFKKSRETSMKATKKRNARIAVILRKAMAVGIVATEEEIAEEMKKSEK